MTPELKECPNCGGDGAVYVYSIGRGRKLFLVRCENCGNGTCADEDFATVLKLWNARAENPEPKEDDVKMIYISLPNNIDTDEKYTLQKSLCEAASEYLDATTELIEPCPDKDSTEIEELCARLKSMDGAEYVIFPDDWELERECRIDYTIAGEYGKKILIEHGEKLQEEL